MPLIIQSIHRQLNRAVALPLALLLSACGSDYGSAVIGTWKDVKQERYITIEKSTERDVAMSATIYAPSTAASGEGELVSMNQLSMPAKMHNGVLMLTVEAGEIPVLYDSINQLVVLNGTDQYARVSEDVAQLKLGSVRATNN